MKKIFVVVGTRPEAIKLAPLVKTLRADPEAFQVHLCSSGQHSQMLEQTLDSFNLKPDSTLSVMTENQTLASLSGRLFGSLDKKLAEIKPDAVLVQGDTTTVQIAATCAFYMGIPVGHVEAGLRSNNMRSPFPEEFNRRVAALAATWHYAPTELARRNLLEENIPKENIIVTGNTVIDSLYLTRDLVTANPPRLPERIEKILASGSSLILITGHRRENFGAGFENICQGIASLAKDLPDARLVYPVHLNPNAREPVFRRLANIPNVILLDPLAYAPFIRLLLAADIVITDSGGIQEECSALGKPALVTRETTERPEAIAAGNATLVSADPERISRAAQKLLRDKAEIKPSGVFGDGRASARIANHLKTALS